MSSRVRVLVVDDSAFARKVLSTVLDARPDIEVVGTARDGLEALERIAELDPDVITLDLVMPQLDGLGVLNGLAGKSRPAVVVVSMSDADSDLAVSALQNGAVALVHKPTALATDRLYELGEELVERVLEARSARPRPRSIPPPSTRTPDSVRAAAAGTTTAGTTTATTTDRKSPWIATNGTEILVIGTSTGGPQALTQLLPLLPRDFPIPIAIVVHIPHSYTEALAARLDRASQLHVVEAAEGRELGPGTAMIARGGQHMRLQRIGTRLRARLSLDPITALHRPSVDVLFESAAREFGAGALGIVLTGMGNDGLAGSRAIAARSGRVLTESEETCIVHGMPRCVLEAGLSSADVPLPQMAAAIRRAL